MENRLTIALPFYRGLDYLEIAIESVLAQSVPVAQVLVCDDGGVDDGAEEVVRTFADDRIAYHRNPKHLGLVANWNVCFVRATGDLLTLLHADDRLLENYAETMLELAERHSEAVALFCAASIIDAGGAPSRSLADAAKRVLLPRGSGTIVLQGPEALRQIMKGDFIMCPTLCFRKSLLGDRRFSEGWHQVQDLELISRLLMEGETLVGSRRVAYAYRRHPGNATALQSENLLRFDEEFQLFEAIAKQAEALGWQRAARIARRAAIVKLHLLYRALRDLVTLHPGRAFTKLRFLLRRW